MYNDSRKLSDNNIHYTSVRFVTRLGKPASTTSSTVSKDFSVAKIVIPNPVRSTGRQKTCLHAAEKLQRLLCSIGRKFRKEGVSAR